MGTTERKIQETIKKVKGLFREEYRYEIIAPLGSHVSEKEKKIVKNRKKKNIFPSVSSICLTPSKSVRSGNAESISRLNIVQFAFHMHCVHNYDSDKI